MGAGDGLAEPEVADLEVLKGPRGPSRPERIGPKSRIECGFRLREAREFGWEKGRRKAPPEFHLRVRIAPYLPSSARGRCRRA
jgi:hypothetical protein